MKVWALREWRTEGYENRLVRYALPGELISWRVHRCAEPCTMPQVDAVLR